MWQFRPLLRRIPHHQPFILYFFTIRTKAPSWSPPAPVELTPGQRRFTIAMQFNILFSRQTHTHPSKGHMTVRYRMTIRLFMTMRLYMAMHLYTTMQTLTPRRIYTTTILPRTRMRVNLKVNLGVNLRVNLRVN